MAKQSRFNSPEDEPKPPRLSKQSLKELRVLLQFVKPYQFKFYLSLIFIFFSSITTLAFPKFIGDLVNIAVDGGTGSKFLQDVNTIALVLIGILVLQAIISYLRILWFVEVGERTVADLRKALYRRLINLDMQFYAAHRVGELSSRLSADVALIQDTFIYTLAEMLRGILSLVIGVAMILTMSLELSVLMLSTFPVIVIAALVFGRFIRKHSKRAQDALANTGVVVDETLQGIQSVKAFSNEQYEINRYSSGIDAVLNLSLKGAKYRGAFASFLIFTLFSGVVLILWYGANLIQQGTLKIGDLTAFLVYTVFVGAAFAGLGESYSQLMRALGATERIRQLLAQPLEAEAPTVPPANHQHIDLTRRLQGNVRLDQVTFRYPARPEVLVLDGLTLSVNAGEKIAIVGPSGAGKSTLIALLLKFYQPEQGTVYFDDQPANAYPLSYLRQQMALVPQDVLLFGGSIRENILYGNLQASEHQLIEAAKLAHAHDFIRNFPQGYDTIVGERGVKLSGGQRQRIAIARALLRNPAILLLDEATSSLDSESERLVQQALETLMHGRTTFIIAHRLATVRNADRIAVLDKGRIVELGTHNELFQKPDGLYRSLATLQFKVYA